MRLTIDDKHIIKWMWVKKIMKENACSRCLWRKMSWWSIETLIKIWENLALTYYQWEIFSAKCCQELRYRKQIARQVRTQYVDGISSNPVTLKSTLSHSRSLKMVPFDRPYTTFYWSAIVTIVPYYSSILYHFRVIWCWIIRDLELWVKGHSWSLKLIPFESFGVVPIRRGPRRNFAKMFAADKSRMSGLPRREETMIIC